MPLGGDGAVGDAVDVDREGGAEEERTGTAALMAGRVGGTGGRKSSGVRKPAASGRRWWDRRGAAAKGRRQRAGSMAKLAESSPREDYGSSRYGGEVGGSVEELMVEDGRMGVCVVWVICFAH